MILLIPISRYRVAYETGCGRPYSTLESLILQAVEQGAGTLDELWETFGIPRRLLIEVLVTLTQSGWLAVSRVPDKSFMITPDGRQALASGDAPSSLVIVPRDSYVLRDRVTGGLLSSRDRDARYVSDRELEDASIQGVRLTPQAGDQQVDGSRVQHLLPRKPKEWIRWVGPIDLVGRDGLWLPVTVDLEANSLSGLPGAWRHLSEVLLEEARRRAGAVSAEAIAAKWNHRSVGGSDSSQSTPPEWPATICAHDLLCDAIAHEDLFRSVLACAATSVFAGSAFITVSRLDSIQAPLRDALRRGVSVDFLWGYGAERDSLNWLTNQELEARREHWPGRLRFNKTRSGSHAKLLLWDSAPKKFEACVGSCNWLSFGQGAASAEVSIKLSHAGIVAQLCRCAAGLCEGTKEALSAIPSRWQEAAAVMDCMEATTTEPQSPTARVSLILDLDHERAFREWLRTAQRRLLVVSHHLGPVSATRLLAAEQRSRNADFSYRVMYGRSELDRPSLGQIERTVSSSNGALLHVPQQHAKVVVCDDTACVSSYNFLSADPFQTASSAREVGVIIRGEGPVTQLADALAPS